MSCSVCRRDRSRIPARRPSRRCCTRLRPPSSISSPPAMVVMSSRQRSTSISVMSPLTATPVTGPKTSATCLAQCLVVGPNPTLILVANSKMSAMILCTLTSEGQRNRAHSCAERWPPLVKVGWSEFATSVNLGMTRLCCTNRPAGLDTRCTALSWFGHHSSKQPTVTSMTEPHKRAHRHPKRKTAYRVKNWPDYDQSLRDRGDLTLWISQDAMDAWMAPNSGKRGAQPIDADITIETALTLRLLCRLPLRHAEGLLGSVLKLMDLALPCPDHTTLSRRNATFESRRCGRRETHGPVDVIVDSTR